MNRTEQPQPNGTVKVRVGEKALTCLVCGNDTFEERDAVLNTKSAEFFRVAWANRAAEDYICTSCGYVFWFTV